MEILVLQFVIEFIVDNGGKFVVMINSKQSILGWDYHSIVGLLFILLNSIEDLLGLFRKRKRATDTMCESKKSQNQEEVSWADSNKVDKMR